MFPNLTSLRVLKHSLGVLALYSLLYVVFFSPVLFSNRLLAPGDGIIYFLPNFAARREFWEPMIWGGFPAFADAQLMLWYAPAFLFSLAGYAGYQPFILTAYVLASSFTYGYVFWLTKSRFAAWISGCIYGMSGFMVAHAGHATMIHTAAWLPLIVWSLAMLRHDENYRVWFVIGTIAVAASALAGHPQIFVYSVCLSAIFAVVTGWQPGEVSRRKYFLAVITAFALGGGIAAIQLWPTAELASYSWRAALNFPEFVAYELPLRQLPMLVFPYLYGGSPASIYGIPYFGAWASSPDGWGAGELSGYVGIGTLLLASFGLIGYRRNSLARFWFIVATVALLLALGDATPIARLIYHLPILNKFRVPARHFIEFTFSLSVLSGYGVSALQKNKIGFSGIRNILIGFVLCLLLCSTAILLFSAKINELAFQRLGHVIALRPWANAAVAVPLMFLFVECFVLFSWSKSIASRSRAALVAVLLVLDLASFGWFYEWHYRSPYRAYMNAPAAAEPLRTQLETFRQRLVPVRGGTGYVNELPPNLSRLWRIPSASGYGPFILTRVSNLMTMPPHGSIDDSWRDPANQSLNLMAVRYVVVPPEKIEASSTTDAEGTRWAGTDFGVEIGSGCNAANATSYKFDLPQPVSASSILLVGALACSMQLSDNAEVVRLTITDENGRSTSYPILAGRDFSEWAFDCGDVRPTIQHQRAHVFRSYRAQRGTVSCEGHDYVARIQLSAKTEVRRAELKWTGPSGTFAFKKMTAVDEKGTVPLTSIRGSLMDTSRWRPVGSIDASNSGYSSEVAAADQGVGLVFENLAARPRAWLVPEVISLSEQEIFNAVRSSRLPDGRLFDPAKMALVEKPFELHQESASAGSAEVVSATSRSIEVHTSSTTPAFLVASDVFYPGWQASVDGVDRDISQTDYVLRGLSVPSGSHVVRFEFRPSSLYFGALVSITSLSLLFVPVFLVRRKSHAG